MPGRRASANATSASRIATAPSAYIAGTATSAGRSSTRASSPASPGRDTRPKISYLNRVVGGQEQRRTAHHENQPVGPGRVVRVGDDQLVADRRADHPEHHEQVGLRRRLGQPSRRAGRPQRLREQVTGPVEVDPPEQRRDHERDRERHRGVAGELLPAVGHADHQDRLAERDEEDLLVALGEVLPGRRATAGPARPRAGAAASPGACRDGPPPARRPTAPGADRASARRRARAGR